MITASIKSRPIGTGLVVSIVLHIALILLIMFGLPIFWQPEPLPEVIGVQMAQLSDITAAPKSAKVNNQKIVKGADAPKPPEKQPPKPQTPPPPPNPQTQAAPPPPQPPAPPQPESKPAEPPKEEAEAIPDKTKKPEEKKPDEKKPEAKPEQKKPDKKPADKPKAQGKSPSAASNNGGDPKPEAESAPKKDEEGENGDKPVKSGPFGLRRGRRRRAQALARGIRY